MVRKSLKRVPSKGRLAVKTALPCFVGKGSRMRMQSLPGSLFPSPKRAWGRG